MNDTLLARVRALLAQAESTTYPAEAEAFNERAAQLIARHGIDEALLAASGAKTDTITSTSIDIDNPYALQKAALLTAVARSMRCKELAQRRPGATTIGKVTLVGYESDLQRVTLIYTSLLLQATSQVTRQRPLRRGDSTISYRKSWWVGFNTAVRDRLTEAERRAAAETPSTGPSTELVLRDRNVAVRDAFREMFPRTISRRTSSARSSDGYSRGQAAGQQANLGAHRVGGNRREIQN